MRAVLIALVAGCVCFAFGATKSVAADNAGQIPASLLASFGADSMQHLSDAQGMEIRGKGIRGSCIPSCRPSCQPTCQPKSCERSPCEVKICIPICRPKCSIGGSG